MTNASAHPPAGPSASPLPVAAGALGRGAPRCLSASTAAPAVPTPTLSADAHAQVVVVGGGYTGLSAALHLAERGLEVVLLEAREPGWGRGGPKRRPVRRRPQARTRTVIRELGAVAGGRLLKLASGAPDLLFGLIERLGITCEAERGGILRAAYNDSQAQALARSVEAWRGLGVSMPSGRTGGMGSSR